MKARSAKIVENRILLKNPMNASTRRVLSEVEGLTINGKSPMVFNRSSVRPQDEQRIFQQN